MLTVYEPLLGNPNTREHHDDEHNDDTNDVQLCKTLINVLSACDYFI